MSVESATRPEVPAGARFAMAVVVGSHTGRVPLVLALSVSPSMLSPANHKLVPMAVRVTVSDNRDANPVVQLEHVTSNDGHEPLGDGHTSSDIQLRQDGTLLLRAERAGQGRDASTPFDILRPTRAGIRRRQQPPFLCPRTRRNS